MVQNIVHNYDQIIIGYTFCIVIQRAIVSLYKFPFTRKTENLRTDHRLITSYCNAICCTGTGAILYTIVRSNFRKSFLSEGELLIISFISIRSRRDPLKILAPTSASFNKVYRSHGMPHSMLFPLRHRLLSLSFPTSGN